MGPWMRKISDGIRSELGVSLVETLVALAILGLIGVASLAGLSTAYSSSGTVEEYSIAESLARTQMEEIRSLPYEDNYPVTVSPPSQYAVSIEVSPLNLDNTLQKVVVAVFKGETPVLRLENLKVK